MLLVATTSTPHNRKCLYISAFSSYKKTEEGELLILKLVRLGSHSELAI